MARQSAPYRVFNFTKTAIDRLPIPESGYIGYKDGGCQYLNLYVTSTGTKTFFTQTRVRGRSRRVTLGKYPLMTIETARKKALSFCGAVNEGIDPWNLEENQRMQNITFGDFFDEYLERYSMVQKRSWKSDRNEITFHAKHLFPRKLSEISRGELQRLHEKIGATRGRYQANIVIKKICAIYNKAIDWGWLGSNPAKGIKKFKEQSRDKFINPSELPYFKRALNEETCQTTKDFVTILLTTGVRKTNALEMKWTQLDLVSGHWNIPMTKNGDSLYLPLVEVALNLLKRRYEDRVSEWVFPREDNPNKHIMAPRKNWDNILARATFYLAKEEPSLHAWIEKHREALKHRSDANQLRAIQKIAISERRKLPENFNGLRFHDLRRTFGSYQALAGVSLPVIGRSLGHKSIQSTMIYSRLNVEAVKSAAEKAITLLGV